MKDIELVRFLPNGTNHDLTAQLVECYRDVFAEGPWHEWLQCPCCKEHWGVRDRAFLASQNFRHCNVPVTDFWPRDQVISDLRHEITGDASCWLAMKDAVVIGFCWGYPITISCLEQKLGIGLQACPPMNSIDRVAYQDEVGVVSSQRGRKIAKAMVARRLQDFLDGGLKFGIVRTRQLPEPSETFLWYTGKLGYQIIAQYPKNDGRVILGRNLDGLKDLLAL